MGFKLALHAERLSHEELEKLMEWRRYHQNSTFQREVRGKWQEMNLRGLLTLYNASSNFDGLESWLSNGKSGAQSRYNAIMRDPRNWRAMP